MAICSSLNRLFLTGVSPPRPRGIGSAPKIAQNVGQRGSAFGVWGSYSTSQVIAPGQRGSWSELRAARCRLKLSPARKTLSIRVPCRKDPIRNPTATLSCFHRGHCGFKGGWGFGRQEMPEKWILIQTHVHAKRCVLARSQELDRREADRVTQQF